MARRQAALDEQQRLQAQAEEQTRRQAEELVRRQQLLDQQSQAQQAALLNLPSASAPNAGASLLAMLQGNNDAAAAAGAMPWSPAPAAPPPAALPGAAVAGLGLESLWDQPGADLPAGGGLPTNGELPAFGRGGRGRGRGVCSAALGTSRPGSDPAAGDGLGLDGLAEGLPTADGDEGGRKGRKKKGRNAKKDEETFGAAADPTRFDDPGGGGLPPPSQGAGGAAPWAGWGAGPAAGGGGMAEIQAAEEQQRAIRAREEQQRLQAQANAMPAGVGGAWAANAAKPAASFAAAARTNSAGSGGPPAGVDLRGADPAVVAQLRAAGIDLDDPEAMLWDYGQAPGAPAAPPPSNGGGAAPPQSPAAAAKGASKKKGKKEEAPSPPPADTGSGMSEKMQKWCGATLKKLTGSDDLTLAEFLYAEEIKDDEIASYITMYLGEKDEVRQFAADYIGRKRHDKGVGPDVEWKTSGKTIGKTMASGYGPPADDDDGFETAGGKKGRNRGGKKKGVDGSALLGFSVESSRIMQGEIQQPE